MEKPIGVSPKAEAILAKINQDSQALRCQEPYARSNLLDAARSLIAELETPGEMISRATWAEPALLATLKTAVDLKLFDELIEDDGAPKSIRRLAEATGSEELLIGRIIKHLVAMKIVEESGADSVAATKISKALAIPKYRDGIVMMSDFLIMPCMKIPQYLARNGYRNPQDATDCPFQSAQDTTKICFEYLAERPKLQECFNNYMGGRRQGERSWFDPDYFPVEDKLQHTELNDSTPLLVDVGGGLGHDAEAFRKSYPDLPGRIIVQDLPRSVEQAAPVGRGIEMLSHDFFSPQPIHGESPQPRHPIPSHFLCQTATDNPLSLAGARFYFLHSVLHNWCDAQCRNILAQLVKVMESGSTVLINDFVVPDQNPHWLMTSLDLIMMGMSAATERTGRQWGRLLGEVGLGIVRIWGHPDSTESLIEAELRR